MGWLLPALPFVLAPGLGWTAPASCPDRVSVEQRLSEADRQRHVSAVVHAPPSPDLPWRLIVVVDDSPPRELEGESCDALADAVVAMLSIHGPEPKPEPEPEPASAPPFDIPPPLPPPAPSTPTHEELPPQPRRPDELTPEPPTPDISPALSAPLWVVGIGGGVHGLGVPVPGGGLGLDLGIRFPRLLVAAYGQWWFRRTTVVTGDVKAAYRLALGGAQACGVAGVGTIDILGCALFEAGELRAEGLHAAPGHTRRHLWMAPGAKLGMQWRVRNPVRIGVTTAALLPLQRQAFAIGDASAGTVGAVELRGVLQVSVALPGPGAKKRDEQ